MPSNQLCETVRVLPPEAWRQRLQQSVESIESLARDLVIGIDNQPGYADELASLGVNRELLRRLERFGRGQLDARLLFNTTPAAGRIMRLGLSDQKTVLTDGIEVLDADESTTRRIPFEDLVPKQVRQVFSGDHVRSLAEQRTVLREEKRKGNISTPDVGYVVFKDHVATTRPGKWSRQLLLQWLQEMR